MVKIATVSLVAAALIIAATAPAEASTASRIHRLERQVDKWQTKAQTYLRQRNTARRERDRARAAINGGLAAQVTEVARAGRISVMQSLIFEPLRVNWLCGASVYQGESLWSLDVNLEKLDFDGDDLVATSCKG